VTASSIIDVSKARAGTAVALINPQGLETFDIQSGILAFDSWNHASRLRRILQFVMSNVRVNRRRHSVGSCMR
jgi:hypothetical protein